MNRLTLKSLSTLLVIATTIAPVGDVRAQPAAKQLFGNQKTSADLAPASHGFYSKGCLAGAVAMPVDGPTWQTMRLSRNRRWAHPTLIKTIEELSINAKRDGWNGLMVGDMSQPRGGPMLTGHASHQIGLDSDIWLTPMPDRRLTYAERETTSAISILKKGSLYVDDTRWNKTYERLLYNAAKFPQVERILVHPGVKKKLCDTVKGNRAWLNKIRPYYGHHYHFHLRIGCQPGSSGCKRQNSTGTDIGCGKNLNWWFKVALAPKKPSTKPKPKPKPPKITRLADLPKACTPVLRARGKSLANAEYKAPSLAAFTAPRLDIPKVDPLAVLSSRPIEAGAATGIMKSGIKLPTTNVPVPTPRPLKRSD